MRAADRDHHWLFIGLANRRLGLPVSRVREMAPLQGKLVRRVPLAPAHVAGVVNLRGQVLTVVDLRVLLGLKAMAAETAEVLQLLRDREADHVNWLRELQASVDESRAFTLATDPHKCKFGRWYDQLLADERQLQYLTNGDVSLFRRLKEFDAPHQQIHAIAHRVAELIASQRVDAARALIEETRNRQLASMVQLFADTRRLIAAVRQPLLIELQHDGAPLGVLVDAVHEIKSIDPDRIEPPHPLAAAGRCVRGFFADQADGKSRVTTLLDAEALHAAAAARV